MIAINTMHNNIMSRCQSIKISEKQKHFNITETKHFGMLISVDFGNVQEYRPKGLCKVKQIQKIPKNLDGAHPIQTFFWKPITDMDRTLKSYELTTVNNVYTN